MTEEPDNFIEVSYEVANKVGGIHQVLESKAGKMIDFYGDNYYTVGPYKEDSAREEFAPRENHPFEEEFKQLENELGIKIHFGVWNVSGSPKAILIDYSGLNKSIDHIKEELWNEYGIDSLNAPEDFDDPVRWSYSVGKLIGKLEESLEGENVVQLHEWLSGPALTGFESPSVFTTHATVLGRALSSSDFDLNKAIETGTINDELASEYGVGPKHEIEKMAAKNADVFTTVSKTTGKEASAVLDTEPDIILPNGFNVEDYPSLEELSYNHTTKKSKMKNFLQAYFEPYYAVDLESDPRIMFVSGRYEFHNKGLDMLIDALAEVNERPGDDLFVFFFIPSDTKGAKMEVLENISLFDELEEYVDSVMPDIRQKLLNSVTSGAEMDNMSDIGDVLDDNTLRSLSANFHERNESPPLCAFDLNYENDNIISYLEKRGLNNSEDDRVKVIFYPTYLSVGDKLLSMDYNDAIVASSAGIFPSYYEPWGYTPVETAANGALSITTDMAGFGKFLQENTDKEERKGIKILEREDKSYEETSQQLADFISDITEYSKTEITERKHNARKLAQLTSWEKLGENYRTAHNEAVNNK